MPRLLHILTTPDDALAKAMIDRHREAPSQEVRVVDLTKSEPDYLALVNEIFAADSIEVW